MTDLEDLQRRLEDLERRMAAMENGVGGLVGVPGTPVVTAASPVPARATADPTTSLIDVRLTNKRFQPENPMGGVYQEAIWFDCVLTLHSQAKPTRAVKGSLEFCDLFGDSRFVIGYTVNDVLQPGRPHRVVGIGFDYNQFISEHGWMLTADLNDMVTRFRVQQVMYTDGTSERLM